MLDKLRGADSASAHRPVDDASAAREPTPAPAAMPPRDRAMAVIGATISIKGDVSGEENLLIEGTVEGSIVLRGHDVTVGEHGKVTADVTASKVKIQGEVQGDIEGLEKVVISSTGRVQGNIVSPRVTLEDGAKFKGRIDMDPSDSSKAAQAATRKAPVGAADKGASEDKRDAGSASTPVANPPGRAAAS